MDSKKISLNFSKWYKKHPVVNLFVIITSIRTIFRVVQLVSNLMIILLNWVLANYDILVTFFTNVKNLVSSLIYEKSSLIHCYKSFFVGRI